MRVKPSKVGKPCCGCTGNLNLPNVKAVFCVGGRSIVFECQCRCHTEPSEP